MWTDFFDIFFLQYPTTCVERCTKNGVLFNQARKNLKLRKNSKEYISLVYQITGSLEDAKKPFEVFAYAIETAKGGVNNKLADEIYKLIRGE